MQLADQDLIANMNRLIDSSVDYWDDNQGANLKYARAQSERMVIGKQIDISKLYRYQIPYVDNEIHVAIDTILSYSCANPPRPEVYPANDTDMAKVLARDIEKALMGYSNSHEVDMIFEEAVRSLLVKRIGIIKLYYDPDRDDIITSWIKPDWFIVSKDAKISDNPEFVCEIHRNSAEELMRIFPNKKNEILGALKVNKSRSKVTTQQVTWREIHATVYDEKNEPTEAVICWFKNVLLQKIKDPNWLYYQEGGKLKNFLDLPIKPYIYVNGYFNDGAHIIDQTTPVEQAYSMQDVLNKRGRQIMENADTANGFLAISDEAITMDDAENLTGDPNQKFVIKTAGRPVSEFILQVPPHMLPNYVIEDKTDLKNTLHGLMGTPSQLTGQNSETEKEGTLGVNVMIKNQATSRQDRLVRVIERAGTRYFNFLAQMMRVHFTEKHWYAYNGGNGEFDKIAISRHMIDPEMTINVRSGTTLPLDKAKQQNVASFAAKLGFISPYDFFKDMGMDNPQQRYDNWYKWKTDPASLARDIESTEQDTQAYIEFVEIMNGKKDVKPYDEADNEHIMTHRKQMLTDKFLKADKSKQRELLDHIEEELKSFEIRTQLEQMSQPPASSGMAGTPGASPSTGQPPAMPLGTPPAQPPMPQPGQPPMPQPMPQSPMPPPPTIGGIMGAGAPIPTPEQQMIAPNAGGIANPSPMGVV